MLPVPACGDPRIPCVDEHRRVEMLLAAPPHDLRLERGCECNLEGKDDAFYAPPFQPAKVNGPCFHVNVIAAV